MYVSRHNFIAAIETGIAAAAAKGEPFSPANAEKLRHVGRTAGRVVVGSYYNEEAECGCPMWQAGLVKFGLVNATRTVDFLDEGCEFFWHPFDLSMPGLNNSVIEVQP